LEAEVKAEIQTVLEEVDKLPARRSAFEHPEKLVIAEL